MIKEEGGSTIAGTFGYMAPEQFMGKADISSDYYSMGIVALEVLTGLSPEKFNKNGEIDWEKIYINPDLKLIIKNITNYKIENRVSDREQFEKLLKADKKKENKINYDIDKIVYYYEKFENNFKEKGEVNISFLSIMIFLSLFILSFSFFFSFTIPFLIISLFIAFVNNYRRKINFIDNIFRRIEFGDEKELQLVIFEFFCKKNLFSSNTYKSRFYYRYDQILENSVDLDLLLKINKDFKEDIDLKDKVFFLEKL